MKKIIILTLLSFSAFINGAGFYDNLKENENFEIDNAKYVVKEIKEELPRDTEQPGTFTLTLQRDIPILLKRTATSGPGIGLKEAQISPLIAINKDSNIQVEIIEKPLAKKDQYINTNDVKMENGIITGTIRIQGINYNVVNTEQGDNKTTYILEYPADIFVQKKISGKVYPLSRGGRIPEEFSPEVLTNKNENTIKVSLAQPLQPQPSAVQKAKDFSYYIGMLKQKITNLSQRIKYYFSNIYTK